MMLLIMTDCILACIQMTLEIKDFFSLHVYVEVRLLIEKGSRRTF